MAQLYNDTVTPPDESEASKKRSRDISVLVPWSCRESFTNHVCGLPGSKEGCRRYRDTINKSKIEVKGIPPQPEGTTEPLVAWIVFQRAVSSESEKVEAFIGKVKPAYSDQHHQVFLGFSQEGLNALRLRENPFPSFIEYRGIVKETGGPVNVKDWVTGQEGSCSRDDQFTLKFDDLSVNRHKEPELSLSDCFGSYAFETLEINDHDLNVQIKLSLADLINAYLNHNENCEFRKDPEYRDLGITKCKVGVKLSQISFLGKDNLDLLNNCAITFSYVDPDTLTIKKLPDQYLGELTPDLSNEVHNLSDLCFRPLSISVSSVDHREPDVINFAHSLSKYGRQQVRPSEVGRSFLCFPIGEVSIYLLHWFILRILAHDSDANREFINQLNKWRASIKEGNLRHGVLFSELISTPVTLPLEPNIFREHDSDQSLCHMDLGIYDVPTPFSDVLITLGLSPDYGPWLESTAKFLDGYFNPKSSDQSLASLPMYRNIGWSESSLLGEITQIPYDAEFYLEAIVDCIAQGKVIEMSPEDVKQELVKHTRRCVFPIADILANIPNKHLMPLYYIFPLWDDVIHQWEGPVIFAHVFTRALNDSENAEPSEEEIFEFGSTLHNLLIPFGTAIAHTYYNVERKKISDLQLAQQAAYTQARAWAHEVKNYTAPIIDYLDSRLLRSEKIVTSKEARDIIRRSRQAVLILNAASKAIQLALSDKVKESKDTDRTELQKLPREHAERIVELALQYLLNYRAEVAEISTEKFFINWSPRYSTQQIVQELAKIIYGSEAKHLRDVEILTNGRIMWVIALLRELIWNIRIEAPATTPGEVNISYSSQIEGDNLYLTIVQQQIEKQGWSLKGIPPGIKHSNALFGEKGAKFGFIDINEGSITNRNLGQRRVEITYRVKVTFAVA